MKLSQSTLRQTLGDRTVGIITSYLLDVDLPDYISDELKSFILLLLNLDTNHLNPKINDIRKHKFLKNVAKM